MYTKDTRSVLLVYELCPFVCMYILVFTKQQRTFCIGKKKIALHDHSWSCMYTETDSVKSIQWHLGWDVHTAQLRSWYKNIKYKVIQSWLHCMVKLIWSFMMGSLLAGFSSQSFGRNGLYWFHQNTISQIQICKNEASLGG